MARRTTQQELIAYLEKNKAFVYNVHVTGYELTHTVISQHLWQADHRIKELYPGCETKLITQSNRVSI